MFSILVRRDGLIDPPPMGEFDAHCHLLPGIDDGPKDVAGSLAIARSLSWMGIKSVVATPHVMSDVYPNSTEGISTAAEAFRIRLREEGIPLEVTAGAEYYLEPELLGRIERGDLLSFGEKRYVLFEGPLAQKSVILEDVIFRLKVAGYTPLLAHPERYHYFSKKPGPDAFARLKELGVCFQVNYPSFLLPRTSRSGETARWLYTKGLIDLFGTDMHQANQDTNTARHVHNHAKQHC
jgi:protein-tyrosine phosphatase